MQSRRMPCKARSVPNNHNAETAFFEIPPDIEHGQILICSHPECASSGRRFRFCKFCDIPVAKRNFARRHSHGQVPPSKDEDDDEDSVSASGRKKARTDNASATPTEFDYDQRSTPSYDGKDKKDENDSLHTFEHEKMRISPAQPTGPFDMTVASPPPIQSRSHHFGSPASGDTGLPASYCEEIGKPKNEPYRHHRPRWEESPMAESPVAIQDVRMHSRSDQSQQGWDVPQSKASMFRQKQTRPVSASENRQSVHRGERTPLPELQPRQGTRGSERKRTSTSSFSFDQSQQQSRQPIEPATTVMHLTSKERNWVSLLHSRPPTSDVEAMRRWMDNVLHMSAVPTTVSSPQMHPPVPHQRHHSDVSTETPPSESFHQENLAMQRVPLTPPPSSRNRSTSHRTSADSGDISPLMARQHPPEAETSYHTSASSHSYYSPDVSRNYETDDLEPYF